MINTIFSLPILLREAFPQLRRLALNQKGQLELTDYRGEKLGIDGNNGLENMGIQEFIQKVEQGFLQKVNEVRFQIHQKRLEYRKK